MNEIHFRVLKVLEEDPEISQRDLSKKMGVSLGKTNYCLKALLDKGLIKAANFKNSKNKIAYRYLLTPKGLEKKSLLAMHFIKRKLSEYDTLKNEIDQLKSEVNSKHIYD